MCDVILRLAFILRGFIQPANGSADCDAEDMQGQATSNCLTDIIPDILLVAEAILPLRTAVPQEELDLRPILQPELGEGCPPSRAPDLDLRPIL